MTMYTNTNNIFVNSSSLDDTDKRFRQLSRQLFGNPVTGFSDHSSEYFYRGPFIDLTDNKRERIRERKRNEERKFIFGEGEAEEKLLSEHCLICYSIIGCRLDGAGGNSGCIHADPVETVCGNEESVHKLIEFLQLIASPLNVQMDAFENSVNQMSGSVEWFCSCCNAAVDLLLCKNRAIRKLQEQISELRLKFFNAINLSSAFTQKYRRSDKHLKQDTGTNFVISEQVNIVDAIRKGLLRAKWPESLEKGLNEKLAKRKRRSGEKRDGDISAALHPNHTTKYLEHTFQTAQNKVELYSDVEDHCEDLDDTTADANEFGGDPLGQSHDDDIEQSKEDDNNFQSDNPNYHSSAAPVANPKDESEKKREQRNLYYRQRRRLIKERFPQLKRDEAIAAYRNLPSEEKPLRRRMKGQPLFSRRRPISQLSKSSYYLKFRLKPESESMSVLEYNKIRRDILAKEQNVKSDDGLPTRASKGLGGGLNLWRKQGGKMYFREMEIHKNQEGLHLCPFSCPNFAPLKDKNALARHINKFHVDLSEAYSCDKCDAKFYYNYDLCLHQKEKHEGGFQCDLCGAHLSNRCTLNQHKRVKHLGIKPHICEHCGKGFASRKDMTIHVRRHTGERPFTCKWCSESFIDKQSLKLHVRRKHPERPSLQRDETAAPFK